MRAGKDEDNRSWNHIPIVEERNDEPHYGYIVLPEGK